MIRLADIEARLRADCPALKLVQGAADLRRVKVAPPVHQMPACWVIPVGERAAPNRTVNAFRQARTVTFGLLLAVGDRSDARGEAARDGLEPVQMAVWDALLGWTAPGGALPVEYEGGEVVEVGAACTWFLMRFNAGDFLRAKGSP